MLRLLRHRRVGLLALGHCLLGLLLDFGARPARSQPVSLKEELTAQERQQLEQQAAALARQGEQRYQQGRLDDAVPLWARVVAIRRRVYSPERFPAGYADLALSLSWLGYLLKAQGELARAEPLDREALAMYRKLYPPERFPDGHPHLAGSLNNLGSLLQARGELVPAEPLFREALAMCRKLYPKERFSDGHPHLARALHNLGALLRDRGELDRAETLYREALAMRRKLYPPERYPDGHSDLAQSLNNLGSLLLSRSELAPAEPLLREALAMHRKLCSPARFPDGHPDLADSLHNLGQLLQACGELDRAELLYREALAMNRKLYPPARFPDGHPHLAASIGSLGYLLLARGEPARAEPYYKDALAMYRKLYPPERFPDGHAHLANSLNNLGYLLLTRGELARAEPYYREALAMKRQLYPPGRFPDGHPDLALSVNNLGNFLQNRGEQAQAELLYREALAMRQKLYPPERFPNGHLYLAGSLINLGNVLRARGELAGAEPLLREALAMFRKLYPPERFPDGHPDLARSLNNLGVLLRDRGELDRAEPYCKGALAMYRKLYPPERFPDGHPDLARCLNNWGGLLQARGKLAQAEPPLGEAVAMLQRLTSALLASSAEVEALNYLTELPFTRDAHLSVTRALPDKTGSAYHGLWHAKGAVTQMLQQRRLTLLAARDPATRDLAAQLTATRQALASLLRPGAAARPERVRPLSDQKEKLEKQLADQLPLYQALHERLQRGPADLAALLPLGVVFCDLTRYWHIVQDPEVPGIKGEKRTLSYVGFVLVRGQPVRRVELGEAGPIDRALAAWRRSLQAGEPTSPAALTLRRRLWQPLEKVFPAGTRTVLLAPDAALTGLPWAALPGGRPATMLLEEHALATVPNGQLLLDLLRAPARSKEGPDLLLVAGGIDYDGPAEPVPLVAAQGLTRAAARGTDQARWAALPGTRTELQAVRRLAGKRAIVELAGVSAGTGRLLAELPRARWAHLATHGFFANPSTHSIFQLTAEDYRRGQGGERIGVGARSPLVLSGLVCGGANRPVKDAEKDDGGILTAEAIAGLNLDGLELAVLSACETGLGEVAGGEGVFGLQRAFHLAGARSVIASLWKIDDTATQALMAEFYRNLWESKQPKLEALRRAQLAMLLHYDAKAGRLRAPGAAVPVAPAELAAARAKLRTAGRPPLPPLYWAGFVLSGDWR
jgi:CHAT domain-containing protein/Tfp pilus assembly protein PilF